MTPEAIVRKAQQLVSLPDVVVRANELLDSADASVEEIGEVINYDPALAARLLKLVNSAFYNFPSQVETVSRAITLIGTDELRSLIMATAVTETFNKIPGDLIDMDVFWHRSVYCGLVAKELAQLSVGDDGETCFLLGLLHDIGRLLLLSCLPEQEQQILHEAAQKKLSSAQIEQRELGFTAAELGARLLESWQLPEKLWQPIRHQHHPEQAGNFKTQAQLLQLARQLTDCVEPETKSKPPYDLASMTASHINGTELGSDDLEAIACRADLDCFTVLSIVNPRATVIY